MDFNEVVLKHELAVDLADTRLQAEDSLVRGHAQINDTVVEANILVDDGLTSLLRFLTSRTSGLSLLVKTLTACIFDLEGKNKS